MPRAASPHGVEHPAGKPVNVKPPAVIIFPRTPPPAQLRVELRLKSKPAQTSLFFPPSVPTDPKTTTTSPAASTSSFRFCVALAQTRWKSLVFCGAGQKDSRAAASARGLLPLVKGTPRCWFLGRLLAAVLPGQEMIPDGTLWLGAARGGAAHPEVCRRGDAACAGLAAPPPRRGPLCRRGCSADVTCGRAVGVAS